VIKGQYDEAIRDCTEAIRLSPNYAFAYGFRGAAYRQLRIKDRARNDLEKALAIEPTNEFAKGELKNL
jgi:Flp pilus assembly protein TadD